MKYDLLSTYLIKENAQVKMSVVGKPEETPSRASGGLWTPVPTLLGL